MHSNNITSSIIKAVNTQISRALSLVHRGSHTVSSSDYSTYSKISIALSAIVTSSIVLGYIQRKSKKNHKESRLGMPKHFSIDSSTETHIPSHSLQSNYKGQSSSSGQNPEQRQTTVAPDTASPKLSMSIETKNQSPRHESSTATVSTEPRSPKPEIMTPEKSLKAVTTATDSPLKPKPTTASTDSRHHAGENIITLNAKINIINAALFAKGLEPLPENAHEDDRVEDDDAQSLIGSSVADSDSSSEASSDLSDGEDSFVPRQ